MIQRLIGLIIGGSVTFLLLILFDDGRIISEQYVGFLTAVVIGALVTAFWPLIWRLIVARRAQAHRDEIVRDEVQRQVATRQESAQQGTAVRQDAATRRDTEEHLRDRDLGPSPLDE